MFKVYSSVFRRIKKYVNEITKYRLFKSLSRKRLNKTTKKSLIIQTRKYLKTRVSQVKFDITAKKKFIEIINYAVYRR